MALVVGHLSVPEVVANAHGVGGTHVDCHVLDPLGMPVVPRQFLRKFIPNRFILSGRSEESSLGGKFNEHRELVVSFALIHLVDSHPHHVGEVQPRLRRLHVGDEHTLNQRVLLAEDLACTLNWHPPHQGHGKESKLPGAVLAARH